MKEKLLAVRAFNGLKIDKPKNVQAQLDIQKEICVNREVIDKTRNGYEVNYMHEPCYEIIKEPDGNLAYLMGYGFYERIAKIMEKNDIEMVSVDQYPASAEDAIRLVPDMKVADNIAWRDNQKDIIDDMMINRTGQYVAPTGSGKSFLARNICSVFPRARIIYSTYSTSVLVDTYLAVTADGQIDAGIYCSQKKENVDARVLFCSVGCLQRFVDRVWDIFLLDEKHECATLAKMEVITKVKCRRAFGLSANHDQRADKADKWLVAPFGENRVSSSYQEVVDNGDIVPIEVHWRPVPGCAHLGRIDSKSSQFERNVVWSNDRRNELIAEEARNSTEKGQTLVYVKTVEHIYRLKQLLNCPVAHAKLDTDRWNSLKREGLVANDAKNPTAKELSELRHAFSRNEVPLAICNSVWKRGVNFHYLKTLIRGDASGSYHDATQITGRLTRKSEGKTKGVVIDFLDEFHFTMKNKARTRISAYRQIGYSQVGAKK